MTAFCAKFQMFYAKLVSELRSALWRQKVETPSPIHQFNELLAAKKRDEAIALAETHLAKFPGNGQLLTALGGAKREAGDLSGAVACWRQAYACAPESAEVRFNLLCGVREQGADSVLAEQLIDSLRYNPDELIFSASNPDASRLHRSLENRGVALIRHCFPLTLTERWHDNLLKNIRSISGIHGYEDATNQDRVWPLYFLAHQRDPQSLVTRFANGIASNPHFECFVTESDRNETSRLIASHLQNTSVGSAIGKFVGLSDLNARVEYSVARLLHSPPGAGPGGCHQDARLQSRQDRFVTLWIPLTPCGPATAPSLAVVPFLISGYFPVDDDTLNIDRGVIPDEMWFAPQFEPGDVLIHSTFTIHKTMLTDGMRGYRTSIDARIF